MSKANNIALVLIVVFLCTSPAMAQTSVDYLIVTPEYFVPYLKPLVELKVLQGYSVGIISLSGRDFTAEEIREMILEASPKYVQLIGDVDNGDLTMPAFKGTAYGRVTDLYYGVVDDGYIQTIPVGRLPARSSGDLSRMIFNLKYNRYPADTMFFVLHDWEEWYRDILFPEYREILGGGFTSIYRDCSLAVELAKEPYESLVIMAHGVAASSGGCLSRTVVESVNIESFVFSGGCYTGDFSYPVSYSELLMTRGATGVIASSYLNYIPYHDWFLQPFMREHFANPDATIGELMNFAKDAFHSRLYGINSESWYAEVCGTAYGPQSDIHELWIDESYNLLGDPSMRFGEFIDFPLYNTYLPMIQNGGDE